VHLTKREIETAQWVAAGQPAKEIAFTMGISLHTVHKHFKNLHSKLGVRNQAELIMRMIRMGHVSLAPREKVMQLIHRPLFDALKSGEIVVTEAGRITAQQGLFWGNLSVEDALASGYVELNDKRQAEEDAHCDEFKKLIGQ
jgi:DNA-binding CsgD family transcriptional regulator